MAENVVGSVKLEISSPGAERATDAIKRFTGAADQAGIVEDKVTKIHERNERALINIARQFDVNFRKADNLARATEKLRRAEEAGLAGTREHIAARSALAKAINDNAVAFSKLETSMQKASSIASGMSLFGGMTDPTGITSKLSSFVKAQKEVLLKESEQAGREMSARIVTGMSSAGGMTDQTGITAKLSSFVKAQKEVLLKEAEQAGREMSARIVTGMSSAGGMTDPTNMTRRMSASAQEATKTAKLNRQQWANVSAQLQDIFVMTAVGASPITTAIQQGPQLLSALSGPAGLTAGLKEFGSVALRVATHPVTLMATAMGTAAVAAARWQTQTDALTVSLNGLGRASGLTAGGAALLAERAARASGISVSSARDLTAQFLGAGVPGRAISGAVGLTQDFGRKFGMTNADSATMLAGALADPAKGAQELANKLGLVSFAQREEINRLVDLGDRTGAAARLVDILRGSLEKLEDPTWSISRAFESLKNAASNFLSRIGRGVVGGEVENEFARQARVAQAERNLVSGRLDDALSRQLGIDSLASEAALAAKEITAQTYAEHEAVIIERGRTQALLDTKNATQHLMDAEAQRMRLLAEAQRQVNDYLRQGERDRFMSGARTPFERGRRQIILEGREILRNIPGGDAPVTRRTQRATPSPATMTVTELLREAERRGLEPTQDNFRKLREEGVGSGRFRGRLVRLDEGLSQSTIDVPSVDRGGLARQAGAETATRMRAFEREQRETFKFQVNQDIEAQNRLLDANASALGKSTGEMERARREAELTNQAKQQGIPLSEDMSRAISEEAQRYGDLAEKAEKVSDAQRHLMEVMDTVRSSASDVIGGLASDFAHGKRAVDAVTDALSRMGDRLISLASNMAVESIFGKMGSSGGITGGLFGVLKSLFGFADGGVMTPQGPLPLRRYASGGIANSPQLALFGEGRGAEAYVPLPDGRAIPVNMRGQNDNRTAPVTVNLIGAPAGTQVKEQTDFGGGRRIDVVMDERIAAAMGSPQGAEAARANYGMQRQVARR